MQINYAEAYFAIWKKLIMAIESCIDRNPKPFIRTARAGVSWKKVKRARQGKRKATNAVAKRIKK